jgi:hypothetical protein
MSMSRRCDVTKAVDQQWYMVLGNFEHAHDLEDCTVFGPYATQELCEKELDFHSNPGSMNIDESGTRPVPPNVTEPTKKRRHRISFPRW